MPMIYMFFIFIILGVFLIAASEHDNFYCGAGLMLVIVSSIAILVYIYKGIREEAVRDYLNSKIQVDTLSVTPNGEILDIEIK